MSDDAGDQHASQSDVAATGVVLVAHGSRSPDANADFVRLTELVRRSSDFACVEPAYLQLVEPTIVEAADRCVNAGVRRILMLPYFLFAGAHAVADMERYRQELSAWHPHVEFVVCEALGVHATLVDLILERLEQGLIDGRAARG